MAKFCTHCGNEVNEEAAVCLKCGCAIPRTMHNNITGGCSTVDLTNFINVISQRIKTNGIIWIVIAGLQILMGISFNWLLLIVGILNLISSIQDLNYSKEIMNKPIGIVAKMKPLTGTIVVLIYNLVIGGVIGIAGSIYYLIAVRGYVLENEQAFLEIENQYIAN